MSPQFSSPNFRRKIPLSALEILESKVARFALSALGRNFLSGPPPIHATITADGWDPECADSPRRLIPTPAHDSASLQLP